MEVPHDGQPMELTVPPRCRPSISMHRRRPRHEHRCLSTDHAEGVNARDTSASSFIARRPIPSVTFSLPAKPRLTFISSTNHDLPPLTASAARREVIGISSDGHSPRHATANEAADDHSTPLRWHPVLPPALSKLQHYLPPEDKDLQTARAPYADFPEARPKHTSPSKQAFEGQQGEGKGGEGEHWSWVSDSDAMPALASSLTLTTSSNGALH